MTRSYNTIFSGSRYSIRSLQKMYVVDFKSGKRVLIDKATFQPNQPVDEKTLISILEDIQRTNSKKGRR